MKRMEERAIDSYRAVRTKAEMDALRNAKFERWLAALSTLSTENTNTLNGAVRQHSSAAHHPDRESSATRNGNAIVATTHQQHERAEAICNILPNKKPPEKAIENRRAVEATAKTDAMIIASLNRALAQLTVPANANSQIRETSSAPVRQKNSCIPVDLRKHQLVRRSSPPLSGVEWRLHFLASDGSVRNVAELKRRVAEAGVCANVRKEVWHFLLIDYDRKSVSPADRRFAERRAYEICKSRWQESRKEALWTCSRCDDASEQIDKDVPRTNPGHVLFEGDNSDNRRMLHGVLKAYAVYNRELRYVQGMSDMLAPIILLTEGDEEKAFWLFVGVMKRMKKNFGSDQQHYKDQLQALHDILMILDPELLDYLESKDAEDMLKTISYSWLKLLFKRLFSFEDTLRLWEIFWTDQPCKNFDLLFCFSIIQSQREVILKSDGVEEIWKSLTDFAMKIDLNQTLSRAEGIYHRLLARQNRLPANLRELFDFTALVSFVAPLSPDSSWVMID